MIRWIIALCLIAFTVATAPLHADGDTVIPAAPRSAGH